MFSLSTLLFFLNVRYISLLLAFLHNIYLLAFFFYVPIDIYQFFFISAFVLILAPLHVSAILYYISMPPYISITDQHYAFSLFFFASADKYQLLHISAIISTFLHISAPNLLRISVSNLLHISAIKYQYFRIYQHLVFIMVKLVQTKTMKQALLQFPIDIMRNDKRVQSRFKNEAWT